MRGYRENEVVRDNGVNGSIEFDVPLVGRGDGAALVELAAFFDAGYSWNADRRSKGLQTLASPGLGLRVTPSDRVQCQLYWGYGLTDPEYEGDWSLQDSGIQFMFAVRFP